jgi:hypothetical protein
VDPKLIGLPDPDPVLTILSQRLEEEEKSMLILEKVKI